MLNSLVLPHVTDLRLLYGKVKLTNITKYVAVFFIKDWYVRGCGVEEKGIGCYLCSALLHLERGLEVFWSILLDDGFRTEF